MGQQHFGSTHCCCAWHQGPGGPAHGAQETMGLSSCWWAKHLALDYFEKKAGEEECCEGMVAWAQPSGKLRLSAAQGTAQDLALAAQKHPHPPLTHAAHADVAATPRPWRCSRQPSARPDPMEPAEQLWQGQARLGPGTAAASHPQPSAQGWGLSPTGQR